MSDRIVEFLVSQNGLAESVSRQEDVAVVLRAIRDDMLLAWLNSEIHTIGDVEHWLNERIRSLGDETTSGDTTLEPAVNRPTDHSGRRMTDSTSTVPAVEIGAQREEPVPNE